MITPIKVGLHKLLALVMSLSLGVIIPLGSLTVYAQSAPTDPDNPAEDFEVDFENPTLAELLTAEEAAAAAAGLDTTGFGGAEEPEPHTSYFGPLVDNANGPLGLTLNGSTAAVVRNGDEVTYYLPNDLTAPDSAEASANPDDSTDWPFVSPFWAATKTFQDKLSATDLYGSRLSISNDDLVALIGENGGNCAPGAWNEAEDDYFDNGFCDPPRADRRIILAIDYLLRARSEGGGGREYLKINKIIQLTPEFNELDTSDSQNIGEPVTRDFDHDGKYDAPTVHNPAEPDDTPLEEQEGYFDLNGNGRWDETLSQQTIASNTPNGGKISPHYVDIDTPPEFRVNGETGRQQPTEFSSNNNLISQAIDISEIDRIRITTRVVRQGLFSKSTKYNYQKPINIKVAWQSDEGIAAHPLPELSVHELIKDMSVNSILELLDADGILGDFDFQGRSLDTLSTEDIAKFIGGRLLSSLLDGTDISNFNFDDTLRDFGAIVLAGSFNIDVEAIRNAKSMADIEEYAGRTDTAKQLGLTGVIVGNTKTELYQSIGRQRFADLLGVKAYALTDYAGVDGFKEALGWGRIEQRLPVPEKSFASNNIDEVKQAVKSNRYNIIFTNDNASIIAERLQITTDQVLDFIRTGNVHDFKMAVGEVVWQNNIERYKVNNYIPRHPACVALSVAGEAVDNGGVAEGSLITARNSLEDLPDVSDANVNGTLASYIPRLNSLKDTIRSTADFSEDRNNESGGRPGFTFPVVLTTQCTYTNATVNNNARSNFLFAYNEADGIRAQLESLITDLEHLKPVVRGNAAQINHVEQFPWASRLYAALESLYITRNLLTQYDSYDRNPDGTTGQQRDMAFNMPAGVTYDIIGGGSTGAEAFKNAGIWYLSQRLPNSQKNSFIFAANSADADGQRQFVPADPRQEIYRDVFLSDRPAHEFRRIGRRIILNQIQNSPNAEKLKQTDIVTDALFYFNRYQTIQTALQVIRANLGSLPTDVQTELRAKIDNIEGLVDGAQQAYQDHEAEADSLAAKAVVRDFRDDIYDLIDTVDHSDSLNGINEVLGAARDLERAVMEILEGQDVEYDSDIPSDLSVPETGGTVNHSGTDTINNIIGTDDLFVRAGFQTISGNMSMQEILTQLGIAKLSRLFELPTDALFEYLNSDNKDQDSFFAAVGRGRRLQQHHRPAADRAIEISEGKDYLRRYTIPGLAKKLNIDFPDWIEPEDVADFMLGNTTRALVSLGGRQLEHALGLPKNFITDVVYPEGNTDALRNENRQHSIINVVLKKLGMDLDLPDGFVLDQNPVVSMGSARIEGALGLERGEFSGTREEIVQRLGRERFMTAIGLRLPLAAVIKKQTITQLTRTVAGQLKEFNICNPFPELIPDAPDTECDATETSTMADLRNALTAYNQILETEIDNVFRGGTLYGFDSQDGKEQQDSIRRTGLLDLKLKSIDNRLHVPNSDDTHTIGTTQKWLEGQITTEQFAITAGENAAELFGSDVFAAALTRMGVDGQVFDELVGNADNRHFLVNFFKRSSFDLHDGANDEQDRQDFAQLYKILSKAFSINLDKALNFEAGTFARLITEKDTDDILFDQGVRLLSKKYLHIDLSYDTGEYDRTINIKRVMQRVIFGAFYDADQQLFVYDSANPYNGAIQGIRELNDIALQFTRDQIGDDLLPYIKAPINALFAIADMNIQSMEEGAQVLSIAQSMRSARQDNDRLTNDVLGRIAHEAQSLRTLSLNNSGGQANSVINAIAVASKTGTTPSNATNDPEGDAVYDTAIDQSLDDSTDPSYAETPPEPENETPGTHLGTINGTNHNNANKANAIAALNAAGKDELALEHIQLVNQAAWKVLKKEFAFALADFGLSKIIGADIVAPGLARRLIDGTAKDKTEAIAYLASNILVKNFGGPGSELHEAGLDWLIEENTIESFLNLMQGHGQDFGDILTDQAAGRLNRLEADLFQHVTFFQYAGLKPGTLVGLFGYAITGSTGNFALFGNNFKGLGQLYNTDWILGRVFFGAEKLTKIPAGKFAQMYILGKTFYKAYTAWQAEKMAQNVEGAVQDTAKLAKLKTQWVNAAIQLGVFVIDLVFGKDIAKFETRLGLPPGTITQAIGIILTGLLVGTGPMFFVTLGLFVIFTLFGFGHTRIQTRATADGYFPYVGRKGWYTPPLEPSSGNIPYPQWPSADVLDNFARPSSGGSGEFDPTIESEKISGFKEAARGKVIGLINDLFQADGRPNNQGVDTYTLLRDMPHQIFIQQINEEPLPANLDKNYVGSQANLYLKDKRYSTVIKRINIQYFGNSACNNGQINVGDNNPNNLPDAANWGICTSSGFRDVVHIGF